MTCRMPDYLEIVPVMATGLFAGAALGITIGDQPARECIDPQAAREHFKEWYPRIAKPQVGDGAMLQLATFSDNLMGLNPEPATWHEDYPHRYVTLRAGIFCSHCCSILGLAGIQGWSEPQPRCDDCGADGCNASLDAGGDHAHQ